MHTSGPGSRKELGEISEGVLKLRTSAPHKATQLKAIKTAMDTVGP